ncbi:MAG: hypothetical protein WC242_03490 [Candidatus Paceibacterota bacterium]|jgi:rod shape-determining protein MreD
MIKSFFLKLIIVFLAIFIQFSVLSRFGIDKYFDPLFLIIFIWIILENYDFIFLLTFIGGLLFDLFSAIPLGSKTIIYLIFCFALILIRQNFLRSLTFLTLLGLSFVSTCLYFIVKNIFFVILSIDGRFGILILIQILLTNLVIILLALLFKKKLFVND